MPLKKLKKLKKATKTTPAPAPVAPSKRPLKRSSAKSVSSPAPARGKPRTTPSGPTPPPQLFLTVRLADEPDKMCTVCKKTPHVTVTVPFSFNCQYKFHLCKLHQRQLWDYLGGM